MCGAVAVKDNRQLRYPKVLDLAKYCVHGALADGWGSVYQLAGIGKHIGGSANGGHYQYLQKLTTGQWVLRDDEQVPRKMSEAEAMSCQREACALVYFRVPPDRYNYIAQICIHHVLMLSCCSPSPRGLVPRLWIKSELHVHSLLAASLQLSSHACFLAQHHTRLYALLSSKPCFEK